MLQGPKARIQVGAWVRRRRLSHRVRVAVIILAGIDIMVVVVTAALAAAASLAPLVLDMEFAFYASHPQQSL